MFIAYVEVRFASKKLALRTTREMPKLRGKTRWRLLKSRPVCRNLLGPHLHIGAPVAQLDRAFGYEPKGRKFDSCRAHHFPLQKRLLVVTKAFKAKGNDDLSSGRRISRLAGTRTEKWITGKAAGV